MSKHSMGSTLIFSAWQLPRTDHHILVNFTLCQISSTPPRAPATHTASPPSTLPSISISITAVYTDQIQATQAMLPIHLPLTPSNFNLRAAFTYSAGNS